MHQVITALRDGHDIKFTSGNGKDSILRGVITPKEPVLIEPSWKKASRTLREILGKTKR